MSNQENEKRDKLCGNCEHFVVGGLCELVRGQINSKAICDLHEFGDANPIDTKVDPKYTKTETNYKPGFFAETVDEIIPQSIPETFPQGKAQQMYDTLLQRGVSPKEAHRATVEYYSEPEPPYATPWPGPVTGLDLAGNINPMIVPDTGTPLTDFTGLPADVQPYPTTNYSPYGIGGESYRNNPTPDPNSEGSMSNTYEFKNNPAPYSAVWNGLASDVNSEPSMHGEYGFNVAALVPTFPDDYEALHSDSQIHSRGIEPSGAISEAKKDSAKKKFLERMAKWAALLGGIVGMNSLIKKHIDSGTEKPLQVFAEYSATLDDKTCEECRKANGKTFDILETHNRPVLPSENLGYTTRHPHCRCVWNVKKNYKKSPDSISRKEESEIHGIESHISKAAKDGTLHTVKKDGELSKKTTTKNPLKELCSCMNVSLPSINLDLPHDNSKKIHRRKLQEAISDLRTEFKWLTDDYVENAKKLTEDAGGTLYLVRAAGETLTDHRSEGEEYRRKLSADELNSMTRTIIGKSMDINHQPEFETDSTVLDAEFDKKRKEMQAFIIVRDPQINQAISNGKITAVSINGGMPRSESIEPCDDECTDDSCEMCLVPHGVVLGELDGIGMTFVVTDPNGLYWNGHHVPSAEPGIKFTLLQKL